MINTLLDNITINFNTQTLWVLNMSLALIMFGVALEISLADFKQLFKKPKAILIGVLSQFLVLPAFTFLLIFLITPISSIALGMFMVAACPGGNISNFISHLGKANTALSVSLTSIATLLAVIMTPFNLQLWGSLYEPTALLLKNVDIDFLEMMKVVFLLLGIPLFLGMLLKSKKPKLAFEMAKILKVVSIVFFLLLVVLALYNNRVVFIDYIFYVFWIVVLHNLLAFIIGFSLGKFFGLSQQNVRTITIETGIQNSGLGLLLIFTFFDGLGGMALLAAFWGIWHIASGLILATIWNYRTHKKG